MKARRTLRVLPYDPASHPGLALRAQATAAVRVNREGTRWKWRCPFCGSRAKGKLRPGQLVVALLRHEPWCPVLLDEEVVRCPGPG